jgi:murein DD-endopeptidase MepM/ murein hydrolase activator NlpD
MIRAARSFSRIAAASLLVVSGARVSAAQVTLPPSLELRVPKAPTVANSVDGAFVAYELHVTNFGAQPLTLRGVDVVTADPSREVLFTLADSALDQSIARPGVAASAPDRRTIAGGGRTVLYMWMKVDTSVVLTSIRNRVRVEHRSGDTLRVRDLEGPVVPITRAGPVIGPPLRGGPWLTANGPNARSGHRRALIPTGGTATIAQRFAIDFVKLNDSNTTHAGDALVNDNYLAEGVEALAVAVGRVVAVKDSIPENVPGVNSRAVPITLETVGGNHVIINIGGGYYAFYAHLKPGSIRVREGQRVKRGDIIGLVGNSGNSTEPHLHFHISDGDSPLGSEGVPYRLDSFELVGRCTGFGAGCTRDAGTTRRREVPLGGQLVRFP